MKRQLPLKWWLTLSMLAVWFVIIVAFTLVLRSAVERIDTRQRNTIEQQVLSNAKAIALDVVSEVVARDKEALADKVREYLSADAEIHSISVLDKDRGVLFASNKNAAVTAMQRTFKQTGQLEQQITEERSVAWVPIQSSTGGVAGYVLYVKSLTGYLGDKHRLIFSVSLMAVIALGIAFVTAYFVGRGTSGPIIELVAASERIADGDLEQIDITAEGSHEISRLAESIKRMADALRKQVLAIKKLTLEISSVSKETEGTMTNLASSATQQAAAVNETAATVEEMEKAGQSSAGNANLIVSAAEKTRAASSRGRQTVEKTYEIIMQIKDQSQDILDKSKNLLNSVEEVGNVIQSVNSIAEQSKILAVNASIEAAKAGEYGSGFAVVAQEVKDLAQQSKDATLRITLTLTAIREAIEAMVSTAQSGKERSLEGVSTIANAGAVMNDLSDAIRENSDFANVIASNIKQQTIGLTQIAAAIEEINTSALENQTISRNIVDGSRLMNESLLLLTDMVGKWRTPGDLELDNTGAFRRTSNG